MTEDWMMNVSPGDDYYCVAVNLPKPLTVNFIKAICPTYGDVPANTPTDPNYDYPGLPVDELGSAAPGAGSAVAESDIPDNCEKQEPGTWQFDFGTSLGSSDLGTVQNGAVVLTGAQTLQALMGQALGLRSGAARLPVREP